MLIIDQRSEWCTDSAPVPLHPLIIAKLLLLLLSADHLCFAEVMRLLLMLRFRGCCKTSTNATFRLRHWRISRTKVRRERKTSGVKLIGWRTTKTRCRPTWQQAEMSWMRPDRTLTYATPSSLLAVSRWSLLTYQVWLIDVIISIYYAGHIHSSKRNVTVWRPSVCLSYWHTHCDLSRGSMRCGQRTFWPISKQDRHTCYTSAVHHS